MKKRYLIPGTVAVALAIGIAVVTPPRPGKHVRCPRCVIDLTKITTIGENAGSLSPRHEGTLSLNSRGEYALTRSHDLTRVVIYGADGKVASSWGRKGRGPGEFFQIERISWLTDDSLLVLDPGNRRLSVWLRDSSLVRELEFRD